MGHTKKIFKKIVILKSEKKMFFQTSLVLSLTFLATCIFLFFYNEPELGVEIDPGMALTPLPSSIGRGSNPRGYISRIQSGY